MTDPASEICGIILKALDQAQELPVAPDPGKKSRRKAKGGRNTNPAGAVPGTTETPATGQLPGNPAIGGGGGSGGTVRLNGYSIERMNAEWALVLIGDRAVIVREQSTGPIEDRVRILTLDAFKVWLGNKHIETTDEDGKVTKISWAAAWLASPDRRQYAGIEFQPDPGTPPGTHGYLNLWRGFAVEPRPKLNGYAVFRDHMLTNVCGSNAELFRWVFGWFAHLIQRPRERIGTALVLRGRMGTGKSTLGEVIGELFPSHYFLVDSPRYLTGQFNAHMARCLLIQADEATWAGDKEAAGQLKSLVTSKIHMIEKKGIDAIRMDNFVRLVMTSNEGWVVPAGKDERRFCVIDVGDGCAQNGEYFAEMYAELDAGGREALLHDLLTFDLSTVNLRQIPKTEALLEQKIRSLESVDSWWFHRLEAGSTLAEGDEWLREVPRAKLFKDYLDASERIGIRRKSEETVFGIRMRRLVPNLKSDRRTVFGDDGQRRAYLYQLPTLAECREAFEAELGQLVPWDV